MTASTPVFSAASTIARPRPRCGRGAFHVDRLPRQGRWMKGRPCQCCVVAISTGSTSPRSRIRSCSTTRSGGLRPAATRILAASSIRGSITSETTGTSTSGHWQKTLKSSRPRPPHPTSSQADPLGGGSHAGGDGRRGGAAPAAIAATKPRRVTGQEALGEDDMANLLCAQELLRLSKRSKRPLVAETGQQGKSTPTVIRGCPQRWFATPPMKQYCQPRILRNPSNSAAIKKRLFMA